MTLSENAPINVIPGIGRRTSRLLADAGVATVGRFLSLPDFLLEHAFGPSLPALRRKTAALLSQNSRHHFYALLQNVSKQLLA